MTDLQKSEAIAKKSRFGLFSQPLSTAIGDNSPYISSPHPRDEMGKPVTKPRNFVVSPTGKGQLNKSYFGPLNSLATHETRRDVFMQQSLRRIKEEHRKRNQGRKQTSFFPSSGNKSIISASYEYKEQKNPQQDPKRFRRQDGRVEAGARNFYTNSLQRIQYDQLRKQSKSVMDSSSKPQAEDSSKEKRGSTQHEQRFKPNNFSPQLFSSNKEIYGHSSPELPSIAKNKADKMVPFNSMMGSKSGVSGMFTPVHRYEPDPPQEPVTPSKSAHEKESFRSMGNQLTRPTPSVILNKVDIINSARKSVSHRK